MNRTAIIITAATFVLLTGGWWFLMQPAAGGPPVPSAPASAYSKIISLKRSRDTANPALSVLTITHTTGVNDQGTINFGGWKLKSRTTGFEYPLPALVGTEYTYKGVPPSAVSEPVSINPNQADQVIIQEKGSAADDSITVTNEFTMYHLYIGGSQPAWAAHDTIDLFDAQGKLVASASN